MDSRSGDYPNLKLRSECVRTKSNHYYMSLLKPVLVNICLFKISIVYLLIVLLYNASESSLCLSVLGGFTNYYEQG